MALANDSITVTPGSGASVATQLASGKEHQVVSIADHRGHLWGSAPTYVVRSGYTTNKGTVGAAHFELFNDTGSGFVMELFGLYIIPAMTAITGVGMTWQLSRSTAKATGGTNLGFFPFDSSGPVVPTGLTAMSNPTGGGTLTPIISMVSSTEETSIYAMMASQINHIGFAIGPHLQPITINPGEGVQVQQMIASTAGTTDIRAILAIKPQV